MRPFTKPLAGDCHVFTTRDDINSAWADIAQLAPHLGSVFRAAAQGRIAAYSICDRRAAFPWKRLGRSRLPTVVLIGDDDHAATGPDGWACARAAIGWAAAAIVHGAGAEPEHYSEAVEATVEVGRLLMVETSSAHAGAWAARLAPRPTLLILPTDGAHPIAPGAVH